MAERGDFKRAAAHFASGVTVVTTATGGEVYGITCSSFASLSLDPLLVTVSVNARSPLLSQVHESGCFAISILGRDQQDVSQYFATRDRGGSRGGFDGIATSPLSTGAPIVDGCLSYFDCRLHDVLPGGDHRILVGNVVAAGAGGGEPLLYFAGGYRALDPGQEDSPRKRLDSFTDSLAVLFSLLGLEPRDLVEAEDALEPAVAALVARRAGPEQLAALRTLLDEAAAAAADPVRFTELSVGFHNALGRMSGNPVLEVAVGALSRLQHKHYRPHTNADRTVRTMRIHEEIYAAIAAGDAGQARARMHRHVRTVGQGLGAIDEE